MSGHIKEQNLWQSVLLRVVKSMNVSATPIKGSYAFLIKFQIFQTACDVISICERNRHSSPAHQWQVRQTGSRNQYSYGRE
jgi:hypothetical protein